MLVQRAHRAQRYLIVGYQQRLRQLVGQPGQQRLVAGRCAPVAAQYAVRHQLMTRQRLLPGAKSRPR